MTSREILKLKLPLGVLKINFFKDGSVSDSYSGHPAGNVFYAPMNVVFFGSSDFGIPALTRLSRVHRISAIVSTSRKPKGRGLKSVESPVVSFARENALSPIFTPENLNDDSLHQALAGFGADVFVVVAYRLLPESLFSLPPLGTINIHASLLPKYRGPAPVQRAIEAGENETGITVFRIDKGVDTGGILLQKRMSIGPHETSVELSRRLSIYGEELLTEVLVGLEKGTLRTVPQDGSQASLAPKLEKSEAHINWNLPAAVIHNKIRAFKPFPGTYALLEGRRLGIERAEPVDKSGSGEAGSIAGVCADYFDVSCREGMLRVLEVKPESRKSMAVHDFLIGKMVTEGTHLL
jgi:methionyl-tRNA formyltransferase